MSESLNNFKAKFHNTGMQSKWFENIKKELSVKEIASICSYTERTIRDWQKEKFVMNYESLELLCKHLKTPMPKVDKIYKYAHTSEAGKKGANSLIKKYGKMPIDESDRKKAWEKWWLEVGSKSEIKILQARDIKIPRKSKLLAEFVGIVLGDGSITKYRVGITLNSIDDLEYSKYVRRIIEQLFNVKPKIYFRKNMRVVDIVVGRTNLVSYLLELGLMSGNKIRHQVSVPGWILDNNNYACACVRGLMDTDGSFFTHTYSVGNKLYSYKKITFSSASIPLRQNVFDILAYTGIRAHISTTNVRIDATKDVKRYVKLIGSSNPKHLKRYHK